MDSAEKIIQSASFGDVSAVIKHLNEGVSVNAQDCEGVTSLQASSLYGHDEVIKLLLSKSASVDLPNVYGWTPLMLAARHGHTAAVSILLKHRARVNIFNKLGLTPIAAAVWSGQISCVKLLLETGAVIDHVPVGEMGPSECDLTPLMIASLLGHDGILLLLLEKGAPVNHLSTVTGWSPLMLAACNGHKQTVQILVQWGADINVTDVSGRNALDIALLRGQRDVKALLENMAITRTAYASGKDAEFLEAIRNGDSLRVKMILKEDKRNANSVDPVDGTSALMLASMLGYIDIVQSLVCGGSDINAQDSNNGWTALMQAVFYKHSEVVKYLLEKGADIYARAHNGYTVLDLAKYLDDSDKNIISALNAKMKTTADCNVKDMLFPHVMPPLHRKNSLDSRMSSKRSSQSSRLKDWFGSVAERFPVIFPKTSSKCDDQSPTISVADTDSPEEVFEKSTTSGVTVSSKAMLSLSALKSPNRYLAHNLRKHSMEPITPPLLSSPSRSIQPEDSFSYRLLPHGRQQKNCVVSLKTPNLLSNYAKNFPPRSDMKAHIPQEFNVSPLRGETEVVKKSKFDFPSCSEVCSNNVETLNSYSSESEKTYLQNVLLETRNQELGKNFVSSHVLSTSGGLSEILNSESLQKHVKIFKDQEVDIEAFKCLTEEDLNELGINTVASREKLLEIVSKLKL